MAFDMEKLEWFGYPMLKKYSSILPCAYLVWPCLEVNPHDKA